MPSFRAAIKFVLNGVDGETCNKKIKGSTKEQWESLNHFIAEQVRSYVTYEYSFTICINNIGNDSSSSTVSHAQELHGMLRICTNRTNCLQMIFIFAMLTCNWHIYTDVLQKVKSKNISITVTVIPLKKNSEESISENDIVKRKAVIFCPGVNFNVKNDNEKKDNSDYDPDYEIEFYDSEEDVTVDTKENEKKDKNEVNSTVISLKDSSNDPNWNENYDQLKLEIEKATQEFNFLIYLIDRKRLLEKVNKKNEISMMPLDTVSKCVEFHENNCISNGNDLECGYDSDDSTNGTEAYLFVNIIKDGKEEEDEADVDGTEAPAHQVKASFNSLVCFSLFSIFFLFLNCCSYKRCKIPLLLLCVIGDMLDPGVVSALFFGFVFFVFLLFFQEEKVDYYLVDWAFKLCEMNDVTDSLKIINECQSSLNKMIEIIDSFAIAKGNQNDMQDDNNTNESKNDFICFMHPTFNGNINCTNSVGIGRNSTDTTKSINNSSEISNANTNHTDHGTPISKSPTTTMKTMVSRVESGQLPAVENYIHESDCSSSERKQQGNVMYGNEPQESSHDHGGDGGTPGMTIFLSYFGVVITVSWTNKFCFFFVFV